MEKSVESVLALAIVARMIYLKRCILILWGTSEEHGLFESSCAPVGGRVQFSSSYSEENVTLQ